MKNDELETFMSSDIFSGIDAQLRNDAGCTTELDYIEQSSGCSF